MLKACLGGDNEGIVSRDLLGLQEVGLNRAQVGEELASDGYEK